MVELVCCCIDFLLRLGCFGSLCAPRAPMWHHLGTYVAAFGHQVGQIWHSWGAWVAPWAPQRVTMSAIWLPKGWLWRTKGGTFGTMGEPWGPHGAKTRPWKCQNSEIDDSLTVFIHFRVSWGSGGKQVRPRDDRIMQLVGLARGEETKLRGHLALSLEAM